MEKIVYERPRERLKSQGALSLSTNELFQLILGSGSSKVSVAKIARRVAEVHEQTVQFNYEILAQIPGLGDAKICQLMAVQELARRSSSSSSSEPSAGDRSFSWLERGRRASRLTIVYSSLDGSKAIIKTSQQEVVATVHFTHVVKQMFAEIISDHAAGLVIGFAYKRYSLKADMLTLSIIKNAQDTSQVLHLPLRGVYLANKDVVQEFA